MRAIAVVLAAGSFFMPADDAAAQGPLRLGYIDSQAILAQAPGATEAQDQFERDMARYRAELDQIGEELQAMIQQFEQQQLTLSPQARDTQTQSIQAKQEEYNQRAAELEGEAGRPGSDGECERGDHIVVREVPNPSARPGGGDHGRQFVDGDGLALGLEVREAL